MVEDNANPQYSQVHSGKHQVSSKTQKTYSLLIALQRKYQEVGCEVDKPLFGRGFFKSIIRLTLNITDAHAVNSWISYLLDINVLSETQISNIYSLNINTVESHLTLLQKINGEKILCSA